MSKDLISRLLGGQRWGLIYEYSQLLKQGKLTPKLRQEARLVARIMLCDSDSSNRDNAAGLLEDVGNGTDVCALKIACRDQEWVVRCSAYSALAVVGKKRQYRFLRDAALGEENPIARRWAYVAAYDADSERAVPWLLEQWPLETEVAAEVGIVSCLAAVQIEGTVDRLREMASMYEGWVYHCARASLVELGLG
ncbi:MAG: HEAT repeat domain-containing protein [Fimbriimonadaceae bacterium]